MLFKGEYGFEVRGFGVAVGRSRVSVRFELLPCVCAGRIAV